MSNRESILRGYLAAGDAGDLEKLGNYLHEDVLIHDPGGLTTRGLDYEKETWRRARKAMPGLVHEVQEVVGEGPVLATRVELSGTLVGEFAGISGEGKKFKIDQAVFMHIREGKCEELWAIVDTENFRKQVSAS
jgi:predicted ester cyclase